MKRNFLIITGCLSLLLLFSCEQKQTQEIVSDEAILIEVSTAQKQMVDQMGDFTATVQANIKNSISPATPMRISKILVEVGDFVKKGQTLVEMDRTNLNNIKTQLENLKQDYIRYQELLAVGGVSQQQVDQLKVQLDMAQTNYENMIENTHLIAPVNGVVSARNYDIGDFCSAAQPVLKVEQITPVKIFINISESFYPKVKEGMEVDVVCDIFAEQTFKGKVSLVYPTIDPNTRTFVTEITIANNNMKLRPGMFTRVTMAFGKENHVVVTDRSVIKQVGSNEKYVFVIADGKAHFRKVELGRRFDGFYEILSGIEDKEVIATAGLTKLIDGCNIKIKK